MAKQKLGEILLAEGGLNPMELRVALNHQAQHKVRLGQALLQLGLCQEATVAKALARQQGLDFVDLDRFPIQADAIRRVPFHVMKKFFVFPIMITNRELLVASPPNVDLHALEQVAFASSLKVRPVVASSAALARAIAMVERATAKQERYIEPEITLDF